MDSSDFSFSDGNELFGQIKKMTDNEIDQKEIFEFIQNNDRILSVTEYLNGGMGEKALHTQDGHIGLIPGNIADSGNNPIYSINIKNSTLLLAAALVDVKVTSGLAAIALTAMGKTPQSVTKIENKHKCILAEIKHHGKCKIDTLDFEGEECVWNSFPCGFRDEGICKRKRSELETQVEELKKNKIIEEQDGKLKICF